MFKLYNRLRSRRGVSPVIAVVLLIALTVAAVAVIWGITSGFLGGSDAVVDYTVSDTSTDTTESTVRVLLSITQEADLTQARLVGSTGPYTDSTIDATPISFTANDEQSITFTFDTSADGALSGAWTLELTFNVDGNNQIEEITVNY